MSRAARSPLGWYLSFVVVTAVTGPASGQTTYTWQGSGTTDWLSTANWTGGPAGTVPGVTAAGLSTDGTAADVARFNNFPQGSSNGIAIDFGAAGGRLTLGAIDFHDNIGGMALGNSSAGTAGVLRLNGATVAGVSNVILANTTYNYSYYSVSPLPNGGTGGPGVTLELGTTNGVFYTLSSQMIINVPITEATPGSGVTVQGGYLVSLRQANSFSGPVKVVGSILNVNADSRLGLAPVNPTPDRIVLQPDATGARAVLDTNAATFEIHQNRGIAIGPTSGTGEAEIRVPDPTIEGYLPTVTYNGVIANNGAGSGRLVLTGGGRLALGGANTFTGGTLNNGGTLLLTNVNALGTTGTVTITPQGQNEIGFPFAGNLLVQAAGTFGRPVAVTYSWTTIRPVTLGAADFAGAAGTGFSGSVDFSNRPVTLQAGNTHTDGTWFSGAFTGTGNLTITSPFAAGRKVLFTGGTKNYGNLTIENGAVLQVGLPTTGNQSRAIPDTATVTLNGGTLRFTSEIADFETFDALVARTGNPSVVETVTGFGPTLTLTVGAANGSGLFNGVIRQGSGGAVIALVKAGTGTQTLSGANTYTGTTTVNGGTLLATNTTGSATGSGQVTVNAGGTLGGTGFVVPQGVAAPFPVLLMGATVQAGGTDTAAPTRTDVLVLYQGLTFDGAATLKSTVGQSGGTPSAGRVHASAAPSPGGSRFDRDTAGAATDVLTVRLTNDGTLNLSGSNTYTVTVLTYDVLGTGLTAFTNQPNPANFAVAAENFAFASTPLVTLNGGALSVTFTPVPVPEPATVVAVAAAGLGLAHRRWHFRRQPAFPVAVRSRSGRLTPSANRSPHTHGGSPWPCSSAKVWSATAMRSPTSTC